MRPKACTRCRQWKLCCDADETAPHACTRCRSIKTACNFDSTFRRISKSKQLSELQAEVHELKAALAGQHLNSQTSILDYGYPTTHAPCVAPDVHIDERQQQSPEFGFCLTDKVVGNVRVTASQATELFTVFLARCHPYLPFTICRSAEIVHERCPLLFWVICAAASADGLSRQVEPYVKGMIRDVLSPPGSVEVVQALIVICMWPFPFSWHLHDPSFVYSGLADSIGLQIGLHRPTLAVDFSLGRDVHEADPETRLTTWLACYVVHQMQASRRGVPACFLEDHTLLSSFDDPVVPPTLSQLCYIAQLTIKSTNMIGGSAHNPSGLVEPGPRIEMIKLFSTQFECLQRQRLSPMNSIVELAFLSSRLQLSSFALHEDISQCASNHNLDVLAIIHQAQQDAVRLIQIAREQNLAQVPFYVFRSIGYATLMLFRILKHPYASNHDLIKDSIVQARVALGLSVKNDGDVHQGMCRLLQSADGGNGDRRRNIASASTRSRMSFSLVYDSLRAYREHHYQQQQLHSQGQVGIPLSTPAAAAAEADADFDLDGFNWSDFDLMYNMINV